MIPCRHARQSDDVLVPSEGVHTLKMSENFLKRHGIAVDVQGSNVAAVFGLLTKLFFEELGKIRRCSKNLADAGLDGRPQY